VVAARGHVARLAAQGAQTGPAKFSPIRWVYTEIIRALTRHGNGQSQSFAGRKCGKPPRRKLAIAAVDLAKVRFWELPTDRSWVRDSGPIFVVNAKSERALLDWRFQRLGQSTPTGRRTISFPPFVAEKLGLKSWQPTDRDHRVVLEGGSIDVNGAGLLLTTEECLLSKTQERNPPFGRAEYDRVFRRVPRHREGGSG